MRRNCFVFVAMCMFGGALFAEEHAPAPAAEAGVNYSFNHFTPGSGVPSFTAQGGSGFFEYNLNHVLGLVSDFGTYRNGAAANLDTTTFSYLFGPRFNLRMSRVTPYFQTLVGGVRVSSNVAPTADGSMFQQNAFAMGVGGGMDIALTHHIAVKPFQVDYLMTQVPNLWAPSGVQNNLRYSAGVVFQFGGAK